MIFYLNLDRGFDWLWVLWAGGWELGAGGWVRDEEIGDGKVGEKEGVVWALVEVET